MRTTVVLMILLLTLGISMGPAPALAENEAVLQPFPAAYQPVSEAELSEMSGKFLYFNNFDLRQVACCVYQKLPLSENTRAQISSAKAQVKCVYQAGQSFRSCFNYTNGINSVRLENRNSPKTP
jgi:hypothetical protein